MKRLLLVAAAGVVLLVGAPLVVTLTGAVGLAGASGNCAPVTGTAAGSPEVAMTALVVGTRLEASERVLLAAFEAGLVESGMRNLDHGHADSLGVLQQRPSQGWGTPEQIMDVEYAFTSFYRRAIPLDQAGFTGTAGELAAAVQRPRKDLEWKYDAREADALALLGSLGQDMPVGCQPGTASPAPPGYGTPGPCGLSPSTDYARYLITRAFGVTNIGGCAPGTGHVAGSYHYPDANGQAHALDVMVGADRALGDRVAAWAVANAEALNVVQVIWYGDIWQPSSGWQGCKGSTSSCAAKHFDHPHLSFRRGT